MSGFKPVFSASARNTITGTLHRRSIFTTSNRPQIKDVVIVSAIRTPMTGFGGQMASVSATDLGSFAIKGALNRAKLDPKEVQECYMGNVLQAGLGQAPARQAAIAAGLCQSTPCSTIHKVCASGMKSIMMAAQSLMLNHQQVMVAGGMESMSNAPYYLSRGPTKYGGVHLKDSVVADGLTDAYDHIHMGACAEKCAKDFNIGRDAQDAYALTSYKRTANADLNQIFKREIVPVKIIVKKTEKIIETDDQYKNVKLDRIPTLKPAFVKDGTVTAGNASTLSDGAAACVLMTGPKAEELNMKPVAKILGFADAACAPVDYTIAPSLAIPKVLDQCGLKASDVSRWEINEAFSVVALANMMQLQLPPERLNVCGGAVSLGHPIGASGARLVVHLCNVLEQGEIGVAAICNGGGGASAIAIQKL